MNATPTPRMLDVIAASGESGELVFGRKDAQLLDTSACSGVGEWQPIESAPVGCEMFVARAINAPLHMGGTYTTDPYCVWQEEKGRFMRWPHGAMPPTHWVALPPVLTKIGGAA